MTVGFTGHQSLSPATQELLSGEIAGALRALDAVVGLTSLAVGSDQLFASAVLQTGGVVRAVIPCSGYEDTFGTPEALDRYKTLLAAASDVEILPYAKPSEEAFWAAGRRIVEECQLLLAVWDGKPAAGLGGSGDVVDYARRIGRNVHVIWPPGASRG